MHFREEKRPFFSQGAELFQFSAQRGYINLFYSRTINDPSIAAKYTGKIGKTSYSIKAKLMNIGTKQLTPTNNCVATMTIIMFQKNKEGDSLYSTMRKEVSGSPESAGGGVSEAERLLGQDGGGQFAREWMNPLTPNLFAVSDSVLPKAKFDDLPPLFAQRSIWNVSPYTNEGVDCKCVSSSAGMPMKAFRNEYHHNDKENDNETMG